MDLKKEIKLSDLFKRPAKEPKGDTAVATSPSAPSDGAKSFLKRDASLSFRRRPKESGSDSGPEKKDKPKREQAAKDAKAPRRRKSAPVAPQIPLMRAFNLMPTEDPRQAAASGRRPKTAQLVLAVVALVLLAGLGSLFLITNASVADKQSEHDNLRNQLTEREVPVEKPQPIAGDAALVQERDGRRAALSGALGTRVAWDRVLRELSLVLPEDVWLTGLTGTTGTSAADPAVAPDPNAVAGESAVEIKGYARRHEGVALLLSRLAVVPEVESASLVSATAVVVADQALVEFVIKAKVKPTAGGPA